MVAFNDIACDNGRRTRMIRLPADRHGVPRVVAGKVQRAGRFQASLGPDSRTEVLWGEQPQAIRGARFDGGCNLPHEWCTEAALPGNRPHVSACRVVADGSLRR